MAKKIFVLDTNVILHDFRCIKSFKDNEIVIPITVLEEIDRFKTGTSQLNYNARHFARLLDRLSGDMLVEGGVSLGKGGGKIRIVTDCNLDNSIEKIFSEDTADHRILSVAYNLSHASKNQQVVMVSKDVNVRLKAKSLGIVAQDYSTDRIKDIKSLYSGTRVIENFSESTINKLLGVKGKITKKESKIANIFPNEFFILKNKKKSVLAHYDCSNDVIKHVEKNEAYGIKPRNAEQLFALDALMNPNVLLVSLSGKAGTGKTLLALAAALECKKHFNQIYLARPIVPLSNKDIGYLPGDIHAKLDPFMQPLFDNLTVIKNQFSKKDQDYKKLEQLQKEEELVIAPLAYIRGRSFEKVFFIVDEAQNLTPHEVKTIITRAGEGTKFVFTGDPYQIDTPYLDAQSNGLTYLIDKMKGQPIYAHVTLHKGERSALAELASNLL